MGRAPDFNALDGEKLAGRRHAVQLKAAHTEPDEQRRPEPRPRVQLRADFTWAKNDPPPEEGALRCELV